MIYATIISAILILGFLFIFLMQKFEKHSKIILKVFALIFVAVFLLRLGSSDQISSVIALNSNLMSPTLLVIVSILRWATLVCVLIVTMTQFFDVKTLKNLLAFFVPLIVVLNIAFFRYHLIAFVGNDYSFVSYRAIQFACEIVLMGIVSAYYLYKKIKTNDFENIKEQIKYFFIILPLLFLAIIPLDFIQNVFGLIGGEAVDFSLTHRITIYALVLVPGCLYVGFKNKGHTIQRAALVTMSFACVIDYLYSYDWTTITFTNLPLHICNTAVFLIFIAFTLNLRSVYYFTYIVNVIGALFAIVLPNTSGVVFSYWNMHFWYNHIYIAFLPILARMFGHYERPTLPMMRNAIIIFTIYFVSMMFVNAWFNSFASVDYFFLYKDAISKHAAFLDNIRLTYVWYININGAACKVFWLYDILVYVGYVFLMFMIWFFYTVIYKVEDHYRELYNLAKVDSLEIAKFKKELKGRKMTEPINEKGIHMIKISHFTKIYGKNNIKSVDDFNLEVHEGEVFGFLGHNGAGKSTLIKSMVGIQSITEGKIEICGYDIAKQPLQAKMNIGYVSDNHAVYENLTGREYVNYVADLYLVNQKDRDERLDKYVKMFSLSEAIDNQIKTYSHGMKQKVVVIAALIHNPKVWILDEPLTGLDPSSAYQIKECMREHANNGNIVFFSSHVIEVVEKICDKICIIKQGKLQGVFNVKELSEKGVDLEELYMSYINDDKEKQEKFAEMMSKETKE